jgi:hypothetical protein
VRKRRHERTPALSSLLSYSTRRVEMPLSAVSPVRDARLFLYVVHLAEVLLCYEAKMILQYEASRRIVLISRCEFVGPDAAGEWRILGELGRFEDFVNLK